MVAEGGRRTRCLHDDRVSAKQRLHLAALLIVIACATPLFAQSDSNGIEFDPTITQAEFEEFTRLAAQAIYATPVEPAKARGLLGFDIGIATTAVPVDPNALYYQHATNDDFTYGDYLAVPRITASKGLSFGTISAMYSKIPDTDIQVWGASYDMPLTGGNLLQPTLALRGAYSQLNGVDELDLKTYGVELFVSKAFGPITPYIAAGYAKHDATGRITPTVTMKEDGSMSRTTLGVRISMFIPKLVVEATQAEERSYAAKISVGF